MNEYSEIEEFFFGKYRVVTARTIHRMFAYEIECKHIDGAIQTMERSGGYTSRHDAFQEAFNYLTDLLSRR